MSKEKIPTEETETGSFREHSQLEAGSDEDEESISEMLEGEKGITLPFQKSQWHFLGVNERRIRILSAIFVATFWFLLAALAYPGSSWLSQTFSAMTAAFPGGMAGGFMMAFFIAMGFIGILVARDDGYKGVLKFLFPFSDILKIGYSRKEVSTRILNTVGRVTLFATIASVSVIVLVFAPTPVQQIQLSATGQVELIFGIWAFLSIVRAVALMTGVISAAGKDKGFRKAVPISGISDLASKFVEYTFRSTKSYPKLEKPEPSAILPKPVAPPVRRFSETRMSSVSSTLSKLEEQAALTGLDDPGPSQDHSPSTSHSPNSSEEREAVPAAAAAKRPLKRNLSQQSKASSDEEEQEEASVSGGVSPSSSFRSNTEK